MVEESHQEYEKGRNEGTAANGDDDLMMDPSTTAKDNNPARHCVERKKKKRTKKATKQPRVPETAAKLPSSRLAAYGFG